MWECPVSLLSNNGAACLLQIIYRYVYKLRGKCNVARRSDRPIGNSGVERGNGGIERVNGGVERMNDVMAQMRGTGCQ